MIVRHFPALLVVVPLLAAPLVVLVRGTRLAWTIAMAVCLATAPMAWVLLGRVAQSGTISYAIGSWPPPWGIEYRVDIVNAFVSLVVTTIASVVLLYARQSILGELYRGRIPLFYAIYMLCLGGLLGVTISGDVFNLFVFMEISALSSYTLIALSQERRALTSAYQYLIMGSVGATFIARRSTPSSP